MKKLLFILMGIMLTGAGCLRLAPATSNTTDSDQSANEDPNVQQVQGDEAQDPVAQQPGAPTQQPITLMEQPDVLPVENLVDNGTILVFEGKTLQSVRSEQGNIYVTAPLPNATVNNTLLITGNARVFENVVNYRIKDASGAILKSGYTTANASDVGTYGPYQFSVDLSSVPAQTLTIEVYWESAKDGSDADLVSYIVHKQ